MPNDKPRSRSKSAAFKSRTPKSHQSDGHSSNSRSSASYSKPRSSKPFKLHSPKKAVKDTVDGSNNGLENTSESNQTIVFTIDRLADDGRGIAYHQGKTVFVAGAIDGESVSAKIVHSTSKYSEAKVSTIESASEARVTPPCAVFSRCGGCAVQYMSAQKQLSFKQDSVLSQLSRWAKIVPDQVVAPISAGEYGYRQRVRLATDYTKNNDVFMGFREAGSHRIVDVKECTVLDVHLQPLLTLLKQWLLTVPVKVVSHIELVRGIDTANDQLPIDTITVIIRYTRALSLVLRQQLATLLECASLPCLIWYQGDKGAALESAEGIAVDPRLSYSLPLGNNAADTSLNIAFHPQDFIQSNAQVNQSMVQQAVDWMAPKADEHMVDLFCGVGNFSLALAKHAKHVTGVEGVQAMVQRATDNAQSNQISNVHFMMKDLSASDVSGYSIINHAVFDQKTPIDGLLLDPPRAGAKEVCQNIKKLSPQRIVYVSCDSSTFARDAKTLGENGYRLARLGVMDMFPQTTHIEVMALFVLDKTLQNNKKSTRTSLLKRR